MGESKCWLFLLLLGLIESNVLCHMVYTKDPSKFTRYGFEEPGLIKESSNYRPYVKYRYPTYQTSHHGSHKVPGRPLSLPVQQVEQSETVEVFSASPPSILGSFSLFGHETVNAREHASNINRKTPRPTSQDHSISHVAHSLHSNNLPAYSLIARDKVYNQRYPQDYSFDVSPSPSPYRLGSESKAPLRLVPHAHHPHSTSLHPNSFYFEKVQGPPASQHSQFIEQGNYVKPQKPHYKPHATYHLEPVPTPQAPEGLSNYFDRDYHHHDSRYKLSPTRLPYENRFVDFSLNTDHIKPVVDDKRPGHDKLASHLERPFASVFPPPSRISPEKRPFKPFPTPFVSTVSPTPIKFSDAAQPFQILPDVKPEYYPSSSPFTETVFPVSVASIAVDDVSSQAPLIDFPSPLKTNPWKKPKDKIHELSSLRRPFNHSTFSFLPTPTSVTEVYPTPEYEVGPTSLPDNFFSVRGSLKFSEESSAKPIEFQEPVTTDLPETTSIRTRNPQKRRRPTSSPKSTTEASDTPSNHRQTDYYNSDFRKQQRRRKPSSSLRGQDKNKARSTTTTTTTEEPVYEEPGYTEFSTLAPTEFSITTEPYDIADFEPDIKKSKIEFPIQTAEPSIADYKINDNNFEEAYTVKPKAPVTTTLPPEVSTKIRTKASYSTNNRPRFSIKDYRERLKTSTTTTTASPDIKKTSTVRDRTRGNIQFKYTTNDNNNDTDSQKKYKPRVGPSRYKTSTTPAPVTEEGTTERQNTFRPSTSRYKQGTGKYYSRYRSSTATPKDAESTTVSSSKVVIRPKGVFSAKRRPTQIKSSDDLPDFEPDKTKIKSYDNEIIPILTKKIDHESTTTINLRDTVESDEKASIIADLTSSSTNDFHLPDYIKSPAQPKPKDSLAHIQFSTDEPILPLEAFFQTRTKDY